MLKKTIIIIMIFFFIYPPFLYGARDEEEAFEEMKSILDSIPQSTWDAINERAKTDFKKDSIREIQTFNERAYFFRFSKDAKQVISLGVDLVKKIWDIESGKVVQTIPSKHVTDESIYIGFFTRWKVCTN